MRFFEPNSHSVANFCHFYYFSLRFLKRLLVNREEEAEIMKDVPGWIQGTYLGSPVYHNKTFWGDPSAEEFWVHSDYNKGYYGQQFERLYH